MMRHGRQSTFYLLAMVAALAVGLPAGRAAAGPLNSYNLTVLGNLDSNSEVQGTTFVGGNLSGTSNYGISLNVPASSVSLTVGGSITSGNIQLNAGSLVVGQNVAAGTMVNLNSHGNYAVGGTISGTVQGGTHVPFGTPPDVATVTSQLLSQSSGLAALPANSTTSIVSGNQLVFNAAPSGPGNLAVFQVSAADVFQNNSLAQLSINAHGASAIVINVSGTSVLWNNGMNEVGALTTTALRQSVIWNFYQATSIELDRNFNGALLAPLAHLTNSTSIDGSVAVKSFTQRGEVHLPTLTVTPVPEPATWLLAGFAALGLIAVRRRRT